MYGVRRFEKDEVLELLKCGVPSSKIVSLYKIPQSTVTLWVNELKAQGFVFNSRTVSKKQIDDEKRNTGKVLAKPVNNCEAKIINLVSEYLVDDISDFQWLNLQHKINDELKKLALFFMNKSC